MKKILIVTFCLLGLELQAKTTYIPTYDNRIIMIESGELDSVTNQTHSLTMVSKDRLVTCTLAQQVVSEELVRDIKRAKSAAGWAMVAAGLSSFNAGMAQNQMNHTRNKGWAMQRYVDAREDTNASIAASASATAQAEDLKTLLLDIVVRNNSQKEMLITDMDRGAVWFILPNCEIRIPLSKDEECHFRISSCNPLDENVKYINVLGTSTLEKYTIGLETDSFWYVAMSEKAKKGLRYDSPAEDGYIRINKETMTMTSVTSKEFKEIKKSIENSK